MNLNNLDLTKLGLPDIWEVKDVINKVKNVVLNYTEMEAKVHEATNDQSWGASSTLMQEIAQGTFNYQYFNEIMPTIYSRFTEKEARQWRQIYKASRHMKFSALHLLEYLIKNGAERVVDDARTHIATLKFLRNFHYIDEKGKDQGINVRNRAKELVELLSDVNRIKEERKKAKANRNKYIGVGNDVGPSLGGGGSRYEGFGSDSYSGGSYGGGSSSHVYGSGGGFGGDNGYRDEGEGAGGYDYDDSASERVERRRESYSSKGYSSKRQQSSSKPTKEVNLFDFDDKSAPATTNTTTSGTADDWGELQGGDDGGDDFADFQSAPASTSNIANDFADLAASSSKIAQPISPSRKASGNGQSSGLVDLLGDSNEGAGNLSSLTSPGITNKPISPMHMGVLPSSLNFTQQSSLNPKNPNDLWSSAGSLVSLDSLGKQTNTKATTGPSMNSLVGKNTQWGQVATPGLASPGASSSWDAFASIGSVSQSKAAPKTTTQKKSDLDDLLL